MTEVRRAKCLRERRRTIERGNWSESTTAWLF
jgi:hypothetical protein